jgi:hypothetical protein
MKNGVVLFAIMTLLAACSNPQDTAQLARTFCTCMGKLPELNQQFAAQRAEMDQVAQIDLLRMMSDAATDARQCLLDNNLFLREEDPMWMELAPLLDTQCPGWRQILASIQPPMD